MKNLLYIILFVMCKCVHGQAKLPASNYDITIYGSLPNSLAQDSPEIWFYTDYFHNDYDGVQKIPIILKNNKFSIKLHPGKDVGYFRFNHIDRIDPETLWGDLFMIAGGDSICVHAAGNAVYFTGKGSSLLNYQLAIRKQFDAGPRTAVKHGVYNIDNYKKSASWKMSVALDSLNTH